MLDCDSGGRTDGEEPWRPEFRFGGKSQESGCEAETRGLPRPWELSGAAERASPGTGLAAAFTVLTHLPTPASRGLFRESLAGPPPPGPPSRPHPTSSAAEESKRHTRLSLSEPSAPSCSEASAPPQLRRLTCAGAQPPAPCTCLQALARATPPHHCPLQLPFQPPLSRRRAPQPGAHRATSGIMDSLFV